MTSSEHSRRGLKLLLAVIGLLMALASASWACTTYKGQMTLSQTGQTTKTNIGSNSGMGYCDFALTQNMSLSRSSSWTVTVAPQTTGNCIAQLPSGTHDVNKSNAAGVGDCMTNDSSARNIGSIAVDSNGDGATTLAGTKLSTNTSAVCVSTTNSSFGNQMSVTIV